MKGRYGFNFFDIFVIVFCVVFAFICIYPMWYVLVVSLTPYDKFIQQDVVLLPPFPPDPQYYMGILANPTFKNSLLISAAKTLLATTLTLIVTSMMAYGVSKTHIKGMKLINVLVVLTMFFSGGLIPTYFLYNSLGLIKTFWVMVLPFGLHISYFIIMRNYFSYAVSLELEDAAAIDGANQVTLYFRIVMPLSMSMIAAIGLFVAVAQWNDYYSFMMFVNRPALQPYVWVLRRALTEQSFTQTMTNQAQELLDVPCVPPFALRMATIVCAMVPIMCVYPFLQKHFAKGILLGAVKG